ncbi:MAG: DALR domain-containing protein, partial [Chthoniobacterales bacterium]
QFVRYWLHCAHLQVDGQKMAKSLGNFYTLRDVLARGYSGREVRYALMRVHYRAQLNFTWEGMEEARQAVARIDDWLRRLRERSASFQLADGGEEQVENLRYLEALDDDLNISAGLGFLFDTIRETNRALDHGTLTPAAARAWLSWWERIDTVLALSGDDTAVSAEVAALAEQRREARLAKEWRKSDELRDQLAALGWEARDTKDGQTITRRAGV